MNMVKSLYSKLAGSNPMTELATISGVLFLVRHGKIKSSKECLFADAIASIRKRHDFIYELVITRSFAEGEEQLLEEDDENEEEFSFVIDEEIRFGCMKASKEDSDAQGAFAFTWDDLAGDVDDTYRFVTRGRPDVSHENIQAFEDSVLRCIYERKYQKSSKNVSNDELDKLRSSRSPRKSKPEENVPITAEELDDDYEEEEDSDSEIANELTGNMKKLAVSSPNDNDNVENENKQTGQVKSLVSPPDERTLMVSEDAELHLYDQATGSFMLQDKNCLANFWAAPSHACSFWITVSGQDGDNWVSTPVSSEIPVTFVESEQAMTFNFHDTKSNETYTWLLRFSDHHSFERVNTVFSKGLFEEESGQGSWEKLKPDEQKYYQDVFIGDVEMADADSEQEDEEVVPYEDESEEDEEYYDDANDYEDDQDQPSKGKKSKNSQLAVGYRDELSFVVRGDMIGVFQTQPKGHKKLKFMTNIQGLCTPDGKRELEPKKVLLHNQDKTMVLADPLNPHVLYNLDLTTGQVTDEWKISENFEINNFLPESKFAQMTAESTLLGTSRDAVFRIDPRLPQSKLVESQYKKYATRQDFSNAATTRSGKMVIGSSKGHLKLYDKLGGNAKTALPSLGDPIVGMDVSADGRYVLATCPRYLLFIDTTIEHGPNTGASGFEKSFPAAHKPTPKRLTLKPEHSAFLNGAINFTPAKFDTGPDSEEKSIVTSTGDYVIAWNLKRVKQGHLFDYRIRKYGQDIVADNFMFGGDRDIVITTPADIFVEGKKGLQRPTRQSLAGGDIVRQYE